MTSNDSLFSTADGDAQPGNDASGNARRTNDPNHADSIRVGVAMSARETVERFGSANAEYIKGYTGIDQETGQVFAKGLKEIAGHKVNADPLEAAKNIKQQAGFSAEVAATSHDNAEAIINGSKVRTSRTDDLPQYGKNHNVVDRVQLLDGQVIEGSQAQMKFVGDRDQLFKRIAGEDGKFARYRGVKLELPSEQYAGAKEFCQQQAEQLRKNAQQAELHGKPDIAARLRREAANYDQLADNVSDSGLTTKQAIFYREHPELATLRDIARTSHRAGMDGAKCGAVIGGCISLLKNAFSAAQGEMAWREAAVEVGKDTAKAGALGYATAAAGATIKAGLQQSSSEMARALAKTSAPAMAVNVCLSLGVSVKRYVCGEIDETVLLIEVGEKGAGMLSSGMMAALGQIAIPIPFVGAAIGGMVGYTLSTMFYQSALDAARAAAASRVNLARITAFETAARARIAQEQAALDSFMQRELPQLHRETLALFVVVESAGHGSVDDLAAAVNRYATLLGKHLQFSTLAEFDGFMASDEPLRL
ncbi:hypothetical protein [Paraburkholderia sp. J94]|uniref:hypothetical protein n=1 Tax=Paraburkholderia sp. J94 TaxID=2805441 RepID=UPI002AAF0BCE|nr:hypothetical protein [Paraburkholderia sp. J94]